MSNFVLASILLAVMLCQSPTKASPLPNKRIAIPASHKVLLVRVGENQICLLPDNILSER